jgi:hypothetical protein
MFNSITGRYTKQGLWSLFLMSVFPQHLWTLILAFRDVSWLISRTNLWDAIGNISYALIYAFLESLVIFCVLALLGLFLPKQWEANRRSAFMTLLLFTADIWLPFPMLQLIADTGRPLVMLYLISLAIVVPTVTLPVIVFMRSKKALPSLLDIIDRLSLLSMLYLFLDLVGLVIVLIRNIS